MDLNISEQAFRDLVGKATDSIVKHLFTEKVPAGREYAAFQSGSDDETAKRVRELAAG